MSVTRSLLSVMAVLTLAGCSAAQSEGVSPTQPATDVTAGPTAPVTEPDPTDAPTTTAAPATDAPTTTAAPTTDSPTTTVDATTTSTGPATTEPSTTEPSTTEPSTTEPSSTGPTTTTVAPPTTTTPEPPEEELDVFDPACVVKVRRGDTLVQIARTVDSESPDPEGLRIENGLLVGQPERGSLLDVCIGNGIDDIDGESRGDPTEAIRQRAVIRQQLKLNQLFDGYGIRELLVDGVSGPVTRQMLCAFRLSHGLPVSTTDMEAGSDEEKVLMKAKGLNVPFNDAVLAPRWALIDRTCQVMFVGEGYEKLTYVFPTSTGSEGFETRTQNRTRAFRFNPALDNGGWHESSLYPVAEDNPLNGNMYKPIYFDNGQAIHGAGSVPTYPASKGCARLRVEHQDLLVQWLGLADSGPIYSTSTINLAVTVQG